MNGTRWIIMDIIPPHLNCIKIYGKLTLQSNLNATIYVSCIEVSTSDYMYYIRRGENTMAYSLFVGIRYI